MLQNGSDLGAPASAGTGSGGSNNPPPASTGTGKSDAEKQADAVKARIEDLRFQLNQLNATPIDAAIAESLKGIKPTPEQAALISDLTSRIVGLKEAADKSDQAVKLLEQGMADFDAAQAERTNNITAIYNATRTPAEAYAAEVARLQELLGGSAENQDLLNRALDAAKTKFEEAADGTTVFRDAADEAMGILQAGLVDAIWEADNLKEAIRGVVNQLGKMLLNKGLSAAGDAILNAIFGDSATGGPEGGRTLVGERGPEIVDLPAGSYVHTAKASAPMLDQRISSGAIGAGGVTINNNVSVECSGGTPEQNTDLADKVIGQLERSFRGMIRQELADNQRAGGQLNPGMGF
jgi:hypothetical protein